MNRSLIRNASWIIGCKIVQSLIMFIVGALTARYLGPSNYGTISYAASIVAFFVPIMNLGFPSVLVQEFVQNPKEEGKILGTSLFFCILSAIASIIGIVAFSRVANPDEPETIIVCFLYSLKLVFQAGEMLQYWFQAKLLSKYPSVLSLVAYAAVSFYKIYLLITGKSVHWFALSNVVESAVMSLLLVVVYSRLSEQKLSVSISLGKRLLSRSKHYIGTALMVVVFQQTDRIMLKLMLGELSTGFYTAAITSGSICAFVFAAIIDSARPMLFESKKKSDSLFQERIIALYSIITYLSLFHNLAITVLARPIVTLIYGVAYLPTVQILRVSVWSSTFGYYGVIRNIWILSENKQRYLWVINLVGAVVNVIGNYLLIPYMGATGAAFVTVLTQLTANFVLCFVIKPLKQNGRFILQSFNPCVVAKMLLRKGVN